MSSRPSHYDIKFLEVAIIYTFFLKLLYSILLFKQLNALILACFFYYKKVHEYFYCAIDYSSFASLVW